MGCGKRKGPRGRAYGCDCPYYRCYRMILWEVVHVLEETKKNFRSKRLAELRRKLLTFLAEEERLEDLSAIAELFRKRLEGPSSDDKDHHFLKN